jgi:excisionase family DNA binding protein
MQQDEQVLAVGVAEAARRLGLSPRTIALLISRRELPSRKVGRRRIIPVSALEDFLRKDHPTQPDGGKDMREAGEALHVSTRCRNEDE